MHGAHTTNSPWWLIGFQLLSTQAQQSARYLPAYAFGANFNSSNELEVLFSETSATIYRTAWCYITEDSDLLSHSCKRLIPRRMWGLAAKCGVTRNRVTWSCFSFYRSNIINVVCVTDWIRLSYKLAYLKAKTTLRWHIKRIQTLQYYIKYILMVKLYIYKPWRPLGLREVEAPTFSDIRLTDGGKVVSPTRRLLFTSRKIPGTHCC
jgi:hypothetical protein